MWRRPRAVGAPVSTGCRAWRRAARGGQRRGLSVESGSRPGPRRGLSLLMVQGGSCGAVLRRGGRPCEPAARPATRIVRPWLRAAGRSESAVTWLAGEGEGEGWGERESSGVGVGASVTGEAQRAEAPPPAPRRPGHTRSGDGRCARRRASTPGRCGGDAGEMRRSLARGWRGGREREDVMARRFEQSHWDGAGGEG